MWLIQGGSLLELPDDVPVPPGSLPVELPGDFFEDPDAYTVGPYGIRRRPDAELEALRAERAANRLTKEEIAQLKRALAEQRL